MTIYSVWPGCMNESACRTGGCIGKCPVNGQRRDRIALEPGWTDHGPYWLLVGKQAIPLGSARDRAEAQCCGRAAGSCPDCPLIVAPDVCAEAVRAAHSKGALLREVMASRAEQPAAETPWPHDADEMEQSLSAMRAAFDKMDAPLLATNSAERKATPIATGVLDYFPLAMAAIARLSKKGNDKHNPGEPLHWAREKSTDHADCIARHLIERGTIEPESGEAHEACLAWRALALLQLAEEKRLAVKPAGV